MSDAPLFDPRPPSLPGLWIAHDGADNDVVVSSRMRLARNLQGYAFKAKMTRDDSERLTEQMRGVLEDVDAELRWLSVGDLAETLRQVLFERHVISREHAQDEQPRGVAYSNDGTTSVMINEEDHLRIQVFAPGLDLPHLDERINALDEAIAERVPVSFNERFGYLTSCPTNTGTGLRVSVMLHLPALSFRSEDGVGKSIERGIRKVHNAAQKLGLTVRGLYGESSKADGDFYQISNQVTLGRSPAQAIADLDAVLPQVITFERKVRDILLDEHRDNIEDTVWRAWAVLCNARRIESAEALKLLSAVRLGVCLGLLDEPAPPVVHQLLVTMLPAHLKLAEGRELSASERDVVRARLIRRTLTRSRPGEN